MNCIFKTHNPLGKLINFRNEIIDKNLFDAYRNGTISLPPSGIIWNVKYLFFLQIKLIYNLENNKERSIVIVTYALVFYYLFLYF